MWVAYGGGVRGAFPLVEPRWHEYKRHIHWSQHTFSFHYFIHVIYVTMVKKREISIFAHNLFKPGVLSFLAPNYKTSRNSLLFIWRFGEWQIDIQRRKSFYILSFFMHKQINSSTEKEFWKLQIYGPQIFLFIIQHIVTMSKYGHSALNIRRAYSTDILRYT